MNCFHVTLLLIVVPTIALPTIGPNEYIFGGKIVKNNDFPFIVSLRLNGFHYCAGTIINDQWILTAAHCLQFPRTKIVVVVGSNALLTDGISYNVSVIVPNGMYLQTPEYVLNDIGLLQIDGRIEFNDKAQPITVCGSKPNEGDKATVIGWGKTQSFGGASNNLRYLTVTIMNSSDCINRDFPLLILANQICATTPVGQGTCNGDSGGPLIYNGTQCGIVSWGINCATGYPDVYSNTCDQLKWINEVITNY